jgi:hypothetical protein
VDAHQVQRRERPFNKPHHRFGHDAAPPKGLAEPVAQLSRVTKYALALRVIQAQADAADRFIVDGEGKMAFRMG